MASNGWTKEAEAELNAAITKELADTEEKWAADAAKEASSSSAQPTTTTTTTSSNSAIVPTPRKRPRILNHITFKEQCGILVQYFQVSNPALSDFFWDVSLQPYQDWWDLEEIKPWMHWEPKGGWNNFVAAILHHCTSYQMVWDRDAGYEQDWEVEESLEEEEW